MTRPLFVLIALFALAGAADAQCRSRSSYSTYSYSYPQSSYSYGYSTPSYSYVAPAVKEYKEEVVYQKFLAVLPLVTLPSYSAVYQPPVQPQTQAQAQAPARASSELLELKGQNAQILAALDRLGRDVQTLNDRVGTLERAGRFQAPPPRKDQPEQILPPPKEDKGQVKAAALTAATVNASRCAACHQKGNEAHGGDFVLSDEKGAIRLLNDKELRQMARVLAKGTMPKLNKRAAEHQITAALTKEEAEALYGELDRQITLESK